MPDGELISVTINDGIKKFSELGRHNNSNEDKSKYKKVCVGDIAYNSMRMWQGASGYSPYEGIVSPAYTVLSPNPGINSKCLAYQFKLPEIIHTFQVNSQGITSDNWNLKYPALSQIEIFVSKDEQEQAKIAEYFENLDNLITLHQRESYKYSLCHYDLSDVLECLIAIYWEQRKLGECFTERIESMPDGELISVTINDGIKKFSELGRHNNSNEDKSKYKKVCVGDIAYNSMRMWQGASGYSPYEGIVSPAYTVLSPNPGINSKCLAYQFKLPEIIHTFQVNSQGITSDNWNLKYPALSQIEIFVSKDEQEQAKIAEYFENLDNLITLHQRKSPH